MVNKRHKNRIFAVKIIARKNVAVIYSCLGCKTTSFNNAGNFYIIGPNNNVWLRCVRFGRFYDLIFSEFVCE